MTFKYSRDKLPYSHTKLSADAHILKIDQMLREYGITKSQWTKNWDANDITLKFILEPEGGNPIGIKLIAPLLVVKHANRIYNPRTGRSDKIGVSAPNWAISLAMFEHYLKTKLEAIAFGLKDMREEFLADILVKDSEGKERTIAEVIEPALESAGVKFPQLTAPREEAKQ
jgi:hypothetical protein